MSSFTTQIPLKISQLNKQNIEDLTQRLSYQLQGPEQQFKKKFIQIVDESEDKFDKLNKVKKVVAYLNYISGFYSDISQILSYNYQQLQLQDFLIKTDTIENFKYTLNKILSNVFIILKQKLSSLEQKAKNYKNISDIKAKVEKINKNIDSHLQSYSDYFQNTENYTTSTFQLHYSTESDLNEDLSFIEYFIEEFSIKKEINISYKLFKKIQKDQIDIIEPFVGYSDPTKSYKEFRGLLAYGENSRYFYIAIQGTDNSRKTNVNQDFDLISPSENLLPELPKTWKIRQEFAQQTQQDLDTPQTLQKETQAKGFFETLFTKLPTTKPIYFTGYSQGAALAELTCIYTKKVLNDNKYDLRGYFFCLPRIFGKKTAEEINSLFEIDPNSQVNKLIRQNIYGDHRSIAFSSPKEAMNRVRRFIQIGKVLLKDISLFLLKTLLQDPQFLQQPEIQKLHQNHHFDKFETGYLYTHVFTPLYGDNCKGNFLKFLQEFSQSKDQVTIQIFNTVSQIYKKQILDLIPTELKEQLNITESYITGSLIRDQIFRLSTLLLQNTEGIDSFESLVFESPYELKLKLGFLESELHKPKEESFFSQIFGYFKPSQKPSAEGSEQSSEQVIFLQLLKVMIIKFLENKQFSPKLNLLGESLEGLLYFQTHYGDTGMLLQDHLDFHKKFQKIVDLRFIENFYDSELNAHDSNDLQDSFFDSDHNILDQFAPYSYSFKDGRFSPYLINNSNLSKMYAYAKCQSQQSNKEKDEELYRQGLLKKSVCASHSLDCEDFMIFKRRIQAKMQYAKTLLQNAKGIELGISEEQFLRTVIQFRTYADLQIPNLISPEEWQSEFEKIIEASFILSSLFKSVEIISSKDAQEKHQELYHLYKDFLIRVNDLGEGVEIENIKPLHQKFLQDVLQWIHLKEKQKHQDIELLRSSNQDKRY